MLDRLARDRERFFDMLGLEDAQLIAALGGRRREELTGRLQEPLGADAADCAPVVVCAHRTGLPHPRAGGGVMHAHGLAGPPERLSRLALAPSVLIAGGRRTSDYGREVARALARSLGRSGINVAAILRGGVGSAALEGALEAGGGCVALLGRGVEQALRSSEGTLLRALLARGCALAELPGRAPARPWSEAAVELTAASLSMHAVFVEGEADRRDLAIPLRARALGATVAAVPGRVGAPLAEGPHALIRQGASLVRGAADVLELLPPALRAQAAQAPAPMPRLPVHLERVLVAVREGRRTPESLAQVPAQMAEVMLALSELETRGLVRRGAEGTYHARLADP